MTTTEKPEKPHADSSFKQQQLPSFYPQHGAAVLSITMLAVTVVFIILGVLTVVESDSLFELDERYDHVNNYKYPGAGFQSFTFNSTTTSQGTNCKRVITLTKTIPKPVYIFYRLTNYHQNYRQYQESRDDAQFIGDKLDASDYCEPFRYPGDLGSIGGTADGKPYSSFSYNPCGAIAWSMFNDSIALYKVTSTTPIDTTSPTLPSNVELVCDGAAFGTNGQTTNVANKCRKRGIALDVDRDTRFKAPAASASSWDHNGQGSSTDPFLQGGFYAFEAGHRIPLTTDEDFMVWARTASMPDFMKLYRVINTDLVAGDYLLDISENYDSASFAGEKHVVLATRSWIGTKNFVLGISLIVLGCLAFVAVLGMFLLKCTMG